MPYTDPVAEELSTERHPPSQISNIPESATQRQTKFANCRVGVHNEDAANLTYRQRSYQHNPYNNEIPGRRSALNNSLHGCNGFFSMQRREWKIKHICIISQVLFLQLSYPKKSHSVSTLRGVEANMAECYPHSSMTLKPHTTAAQTTLIIGPRDKLTTLTSKFLLSLERKTVLYGLL